MKHAAAFLDRDDTIIRNIPYLTDADQVELMPGAVDGLRLLRDVDYQLIIVSNQSLISRGIGTHTDVDRVNERMQSLLLESDVHLDAIYYCTHTPEDDCYCRKPKPGLLHRAADELTLDLAASIMIGDRDTDVQAGVEAGCRRALQIGQAPLLTLLDAVRNVLANDS